MIWYIFIFTSINLVSETNASLNDIEEVTGSLTVNIPHSTEEDWDKSSLNFDGATTTGTCGKISTTINTNDNPMLFSIWVFDVYKMKSGNTPDGESLDSGTVPFMKANSSTIISSENIVENGIYKFRIRRPLGHPGKSDPDGYSYFWSDPIEVNDCKTTNQTIETFNDDRGNQVVPSTQEDSDTETNSLIPTPNTEIKKDEDDE